MERKKIGDYLANCNIPYSCIGFEYLIDVIEKAMKSSGKLNLTKIYQEIGDEHYASLSSVEKCIRTAIQHTGEIITNKKFVARAIYMFRYSVEA